MRVFGMINLMVTALEPGTEATSNGSSLIRRTIRPNACERRQWWPGNPGDSTRLGHGVQSARDIENPFGVSWDDLGYCHSCARFLLYRLVSYPARYHLALTHSDLIDMSTAPSDNYTGILGDNQASHSNLLGRSLCGDGGGWEGCGRLDGGSRRWASGTATECISTRKIH
jgi:hypothetical protein